MTRISIKKGSKITLRRMSGGATGKRSRLLSFDRKARSVPRSIRLHTNNRKPSTTPVTTILRSPVHSVHTSKDPNLVSRSPKGKLCRLVKCDTDGFQSRKLCRLLRCDKEKRVGGAKRVYRLGRSTTGPLIVKRGLASSRKRLLISRPKRTGKKSRIKISLRR